MFSKITGSVVLENSNVKQLTVKSRITSLLLALIIAFSLSACGDGIRHDYGPTHVVVDLVGREVDVPDNVERVACMYASTAHMLAMLGEEHKIVAAADGVKSDVLMQEKYPEIKSVSTPYVQGAINIEELMALEPDLVLIRFDMYYSESELEKLEKAGVPFLVVDYYNIKQLSESITVLGETFGKEEQAQAYIDYMNDTFSYVDERVRDIPEEGRVRVYHSINSVTTTDVVDSICAEIFSRAGVRNVSVETGLANFGKNMTVTLEEIYNWDADVIVCNEYAVRDYIMNQKKMAALTAVQNGAVYTLPVGVTRWAHHGSMEPHMGTLYLAYLIYPDKFSDLDLVQTIRDYYAEFFELNIDDEMMANILTGYGMRKVSSSAETQ